jgi:hypothetical protein
MMPMMKRPLTILCIPALLLLSSTEGWSLPPCLGKWSRNTWTNCFGAFTLPDGYKYDKYKYVGDFKDGLPHGQGTLTQLESSQELRGSTYSGGWKDGKQHGQGTETITGKHKYSGGWKNGYWHGQGTLTYPDGSKYVVEWKDGQPHGQGTAIFSSGGSKEDDAKKYAKSISDRHEALAEALVLYGNMVNAFHKDAAVIDRGDYIAAEEDMAGYVARIGTLGGLDKVSLPGNDEDLKSVHDYFMISVSYLYESQALLEDSGYDQGSSAMALGMWEEARKNFLTFSELLNQLEGKPPLD